MDERIARHIKNLEETSYNEGSHDLACRCADSLEIIRSLLAQIDNIYADNLALHLELAAAKLDAQSAWSRYETANSSRITTERQLMEANEKLHEIAARGEVVVTRNPAGRIVAVTRQDEEGRILSVIAEAAQESTK